MATTSQHTLVRLLDVDSTLGAGLSDDALALAEAMLVAPVEPLDAGSWQPVVPERPDQHLGFLVLDGVLFRRVAFSDRDPAAGKSFERVDTIYPNVNDGVEGMYFIEQCVASNAENGAWLPLRHARARP